MRILVLMRGAPGAGKSTFIKEHNLEQYTLCADNIRLLFQTPILNEEGNIQISQKNDRVMWELLFNLLEKRMRRGEFSIVDATHTKTKDFERYHKLADKYRYRVYCVDLGSSVSLEEAKRRNKSREAYKYVPEAVLENMYTRFITEKVPKWVTVIKPEEYEETFQWRKADLNEWSAIHHVGDVHGCYTALLKYLGDGLKNNELYVFHGDYFDRGIENYETMKFLFSIMEKPNVVFLEGNHEIHLWRWANGTEAKSREFNYFTAPEFEAKGLSKKQTRMFYRKLRQLLYYEYGENTYIATHGGISALSDNFIYMATEQLIKGVGEYSTPIDDLFEKNMNHLTNIYQIHGHRNVRRLPIVASNNSFNLEGHVETGGDLRVLKITKENPPSMKYIPNNVIKDKYKELQLVDIDDYEENELVETTEAKIPKEEEVVVPIPPLVQQLQGNPLIREKKFGDISSFNFHRQVFYDSLWNEQTIKARGLFINTKTGEIAARSYNKFFNLNEVEDTKKENLAKFLTLPIRAYKKVNGYLGMIGYDSASNNMIFATKSSILNGDYVAWFRDIFYSTVSKDNAERLARYLKGENVTCVFEVVDPINDPHIIEYKEPKIVLLDIVDRTEEYKKRSYEGVAVLARLLGVPHKELATIITSYDDLFLFIEKELNEGWDENNEGYVLEGTNGNMLKIKLPYYKFWKFMRDVKNIYANGGVFSRPGALFTPLANEFHSWLKSQSKTQLKKGIIELRKRFYFEKEAGIVCIKCPVTLNGNLECNYSEGSDCTYPYNKERRCGLIRCCIGCHYNK